MKNTNFIKITLLLAFRFTTIFPKFQAITTKEKFARHQQMGRMCYIILVIFAIIIALASTCFLIFYFGTLGFAFSATEQTSNEKEQSICLLEGIQTAIDEILSFVKEGIATFPVLVSASLTDFMDKVDVSTAVIAYFTKK